MSESTFELVDRADITLNRTGKYVLIEFPMSYTPAFAEELLEAFLNADVIPIIAHPERYSFMLRDPNYLYELVNMGMLAQCNAESLTGVHGVRIKRLTTEFIKSDLIHFIGSDVHHPTMRPWFMDTAFQELKDVLKEGDAADLFGGNAEKVIMGQELATYEPRSVEFSAIDSIKDYVVDIYQGFMRK
jgi:protein-tyrosine phosphatase